MKIYRELYFKGNSEQLLKFTYDIEKYVVGDWKLRARKTGWENYLFFDYCGKDVDNASVSIYLGDNIEKGEIRVGNIVPMKKNELSVDEYNKVLLKFYYVIVNLYKDSNLELDISQLTDDIFNPATIISKEALRKLELFCNSANKSTGSTHPYDQERWFDFICQTVDDNKVFDYDTLANFLKDKDYWGTKPDGYIGVVGKYAWDENKAYELASEYEILCAILQYYKRIKGI